MNQPTIWARVAVLVLLATLTAGCGATKATSNPAPITACIPSSTLEFAYVLDDFDNTVSMFTVDSCTGGFRPTTPPTVGTGANALGSEQMVVNPAGRFAYVANLMSNAADEATISMYTIDAKTGVLTPTMPATVPTGYFPQGIGIDPAGKFVYTANSDDNTISMFTIHQSTGVLTPTAPPSVATGWSPLSITVDPSGRFAYAANQDDGTISMYTMDSVTGILTPTTPATVSAGGSPFA
jgi:6-phosphogluconolactonase